MNWLMIHQHPFANLMEPIWDWQFPGTLDSSTLVKSDGWHISIPLPGMQKKDISIKVEGRQLLIEGTVAKRTKREECYQMVNRSYYIPEHLDLDKIKAHMKDGLLEIDIPTLKSKASGKWIEVEQADDAAIVELKNNSPMIRQLVKLKNKIKGWFS